MVAAEHFDFQGEGLSIRGFCFAQLMFETEYFTQISQRSGHLWILLAECSLVTGQGFTRRGFRLD
jgi:hypothetical protein